MTPQDVETVYEALAQTLDTLAEDKRPLFLAKLALLMAHDLGDAARATQRIAEAAADLDV